MHTLPLWSYEQEKKMTGVGQMNVFMSVCVSGCVCLCVQKGLLILIYWWIENLRLLNMLSFFYVLGSSRLVPHQSGAPSLCMYSVHFPFFLAFSCHSFVLFKYKLQVCRENLGWHALTSWIPQLREGDDGLDRETLQCIWQQGCKISSNMRMWAWIELI